MKTQWLPAWPASASSTNCSVSMELRGVTYACQRCFFFFCQQSLNIQNVSRFSWLSTFNKVGTYGERVYLLSNLLFIIRDFHDGLWMPVEHPSISLLTHRSTTLIECLCFRYLNSGWIGTYLSQLMAVCCSGCFLETISQYCRIRSSVWLVTARELESLGYSISCFMLARADWHLGVAILESSLVASRNRYVKKLCSQNDEGRRVYHVKKGGRFTELPNVPSKLRSSATISKHNA